MNELYCPNCGTQLEEEQIFCPTCVTNVRYVPKMKMFEAYKKMWTSAFDFKGRARRSEYWLACVVNMLVTLVLGIITAFVSALGFLQIIYALAVLIPGLSMAVRRLHDTNRSGHWMWLVLTIYGGFALLVFYCQDKKQPYNRFGKSSKWYSVYDLNGGESEDAV